MKIKYIKDQKGKTTDVVLSLKDWESIKNSFPDIEEITNDIPNWHKEILDQRLENIQKYPENIVTWDTVQEEIKKKYGL
ncbi:addiction module protein [Flavobacterium soli]|uniref:addiction module protein n=1 Tax=Flavobacterium soli TaxID=344881 RepID=UPI000424360C|nr:addiction module protein [Flavobacterium soli]